MTSQNPPSLPLHVERRERRIKYAWRLGSVRRQNRTYITRQPLCPFRPTVGISSSFAARWCFGYRMDRLVRWRGMWFIWACLSACLPVHTPVHTPLPSSVPRVVGKELVPFPPPSTPLHIFCMSAAGIRSIPVAGNHVSSGSITLGKPITR